MRDVLIVAALAVAAGLLAWAGVQLMRAPRGSVAAPLPRGGAPAPTPARPGRHEGATEAYGSELRAMRDMEISPELVSDVENELRWGLIWHEFEHLMQEEIDRAFAPHLAALPVAEDFEQLREQTCPPQLVAA